MDPMTNQYSRLRAIVAGSLAGMAVGVGTVIALLTGVADSTPHYQKMGLTGVTMVMQLLPGSMILGAVFAFPTMAAMVCSVVAAARRWPRCDGAWVWTLAGILFTVPTAYLFSMFQRGDGQFALLSVWSLCLVVGAIAGFFAWMFRHRPERAER